MTEQDKSIRVRANLKEMAKGFSRDITIEITGDRLITLSGEDSDLGNTVSKSLSTILYEEFDSLTKAGKEKGLTFVTEL